MSDAHIRGRDPQPPDDILRQLRIPFVRKATLAWDDVEEETFLIDIGMEGVFVERREPLPNQEAIEIRFAWPGSEIPFRSRCRVAWWHSEGAPLSSKSLPPGAGLQFTEMSDHDRERLRAHLLDYCHQHPRVRRFLRHWPDAERKGDDPTAG
jgi:hypothetical protein